MSFDNAFRPTGNTVLVIATSSTGTAATQWSTGGMPTCFCVNASTAPVYLAWGSSLVTAGIPSTGTPIQGLVLLSTLSRCFQIGPSPSASGWVSAVTSGGSANVYITPGVGF